MSEETSSSGSLTAQVLPEAGFVFDRPQAALVVIDPQKRLLEPRRCRMALFGQSTLRSKRHREQRGRESREALPGG
jgi:hypothetical protein